MGCWQHTNRSSSLQSNSVVARTFFRQRPAQMVLLLDIGNTHTHFATVERGRLRNEGEARTEDWNARGLPAKIERVAPRPGNIAVCSVVPSATKLLAAHAKHRAIPLFQLNHATTRGVGIDYPEPKTIGADRLANAIAAHSRFGAPVVVVDFGTAVTFDVVDAAGNYVGGIIAPGLAAMTNYLHEKTALLPKIEIRDTPAVIGKSTEEAMLIGAVHGYRGLIRELVQKLKRELRSKRLPVIATGGCARLMARRLPEITAVDPLLTLNGLHIAWKLRDT
jgi:type III pantothenate kinase